MATNIAAMPPVRPAPREIPHTVSPGLWALAWKRLKSDHVGMVSLAIVVAPRWFYGPVGRSMRHWAASWAPVWAWLQMPCWASSLARCRPCLR